MHRYLTTCLILLTGFLPLSHAAIPASSPASGPARTFRVAAVQAASLFGKPEANRKHLADMVARAAAGGANVVVLPEAALTGYLTYDIKTTWQTGGRALSEGLSGADPAAAAETVPGPSTDLFARLARVHRLYITVPIVEVDRKTGRYYNTSVLVGPDGGILLHYRKRNPWPWAERGWATDGDRGNPVVDTPYGRLGLLICFDIHQQAAVMGDLKVDTLLYSIAWVDDPGSAWFTRDLPAKAARHGFNIVAANWTVPKTPAPAWHGYGHSRVIGSDGKILAAVKADLAEEIVYADLPLPTGGR